jgi:hypothetical protein
VSRAARPPRAARPAPRDHPATSARPLATGAVPRARLPPGHRSGALRPPAPWPPERCPAPACPLATGAVPRSARPPGDVRPPPGHGSGAPRPRRRPPAARPCRPPPAPRRLPPVPGCWSRLRCPTARDSALLAQGAHGPRARASSLRRGGAGGRFDRVAHRGASISRAGHTANIRPVRRRCGPRGPRLTLVLALGARGAVLLALGARGPATSRSVGALGQDARTAGFAGRRAPPVCG